MENVITTIMNDMRAVLLPEQMDRLQKVLVQRLYEDKQRTSSLTNEDYLKKFIEAKSIEGCSERTLKYYESTIREMFNFVDKPVRYITTEDIRDYLINCQNNNACGKVTIDNKRRNVSSFFSWLEEEDYIIKNPVRRIHKIRTGTTVKETFSDENIEVLRDNCSNNRDIAMLDFLFSTGVRVGELVNLDINDIDFEQRECIVYGKGNKERRVYFDAKTKIHLKRYLNERTDDNPALFVSLNAPYDRLQISGVEIRVRELGKQSGVNKVHPHKFRRSMATKAIDKGMPVEQLQKLLGHSQIDTTMRYAMVNQNNVKNSHRKYIS